jgi:hypothetical protein
MSIVALKRKTAASRGISGGNGFSINGTTRLQGFVGQGVVTRHLVHTPFGGTVPKDSNGNDNAHIVKPSELCNLNNPDVVKSSVLSGAAALRHKISRTQMTVKPTIGNDQLLSQSTYLDRLKRKNLRKIADECPEPDVLPVPPTCPVDKSLFARSYRRAAACKTTITKSLEQEDQQSRLARLAEECSALDPQQPVVAIRRAPIINRL